MHRPTLALTFRGLLLAALPLALTACGSAGWGAGSGLVLGAIVALPLLWTSRARSGPPPICTGYETNYCRSGLIRAECCPKNTKCNFQNPTPFVACGNQLCVDGNDPGRCPAPKARTTGQTEAECGGMWQKACIDRSIVEVCIPLPPTNFTGPWYNPQFTQTFGDHCTTHLLKSDGYPVKHWLIEPFCLGEWTPVCLNGEVTERCLPTSNTSNTSPVSLPAAPVSGFPAATFVTCPDTTCAVGSTAAKVCAK